MNNVIGGVCRSQLTAYIAIMVTIENSPKSVKDLWDKGEEVITYKPNEDTINQDEITVYRAIK